MRPVVATLRRLGVRHYIGGSIASSAYGLMRATADIDLVADLRAEHVDPFVTALQSDYYVSRTAVAEAVARRASFNLIHLSTMFKVDVFVSRDRAYDRQAIERTQVKTLDERSADETLFFASAEDTVLAKLEWYRLGDEVSDRQWNDVLGIMRVQRDALDRRYLSSWAVELGVADLLDKAWKEAESQA